MADRDSALVARLAALIASAYGDVDFVTTYDTEAARKIVAAYPVLLTTTEPRSSNV